MHTFMEMGFSKMIYLCKFNFTLVVLMSIDWYLFHNISQNLAKIKFNAFLESVNIMKLNR